MRMPVLGHLLLRLGLAQYLHHEGQQLFERLKVCGLERHYMLYPTLPLTLFDLRVGMNLHDKRTLGWKRRPLFWSHVSFPHVQPKKCTSPYSTVYRQSKRLRYKAKSSAV
jgi:hypothetical protein